MIFKIYFYYLNDAGTSDKKKKGSKFHLRVHAYVSFFIWWKLRETNPVSQ